MKLIVEYDYSEDDFKALEVKTLKEFYEKYYNNNGILFDEKAESIYYEIDVDFLPMEGQRVATKFGTCIVTYSCYNLDNVVNMYYDNTRIVVSVE